MTSITTVQGSCRHPWKLSAHVGSLSCTSHAAREDCRMTCAVFGASIGFCWGPTSVLGLDCCPGQGGMVWRECLPGRNCCTSCCSSSLNPFLRLTNCCSCCMHVGVLPGDHSLHGDQRRSTGQVTCSYSPRSPQWCVGCCPAAVNLLSAEVKLLHTHKRQDRACSATTATLLSAPLTSQQVLASSRRLLKDENAPNVIDAPPAGCCTNGRRLLSRLGQRSTAWP